jgi:hypothetical protein
MNDRRGLWYVLSMLSLPLLFLARSGHFGQQAKAESEVAVEDWAGYGRVLLSLLAVIAFGAVIVVFVVSIL